MDLIRLIVVLGIVGAIWYLVTTYIPMPGPIRTVITVIVVIALCIFLLQWAGLGHINI